MKTFLHTSLYIVLTLCYQSAIADYRSFNPKLESTNPNIDALTVVSTVSSVNGSIAGFRCPDNSITADPYDSCGVQQIIYPISGKVFVPVVNPLNGETMGAVSQVGTIEATPEFDISFLALGDPTVDWTSLPVLPWTMTTFSMKVSGSTFEYIDGMQLIGGGYPTLGPVEEPNQTNGASLRLGGCEGIKEVSGQGKYANMVGSLCLNGTFSFQPDFAGKGVSNCTLVLHRKWM